MWIAGARVGHGTALVGDRSGKVVPSLIYQKGHVARLEDDDVPSEGHLAARRGLGPKETGIATALFAGEIEKL